MTLIVCVDDLGGMAFNHRRQSQDRVLRERILAMAQGKRLLMSPYSARQFGPQPNLNIQEDFLQEALEGDLCFAETGPLLPYEKWISRLILFRWNRVYPADTHFDIPLVEETGWHLVSSEDFPGSSHEKITMEVYEK